MMDYKSKEKLKRDFIKYFGEEKWNAEELMDKVWPDIIRICDYLGVEPIPVVMDKFADDARFMLEEEYIIISDRLVDDLTEVRKCLTHELRHYYQIKLIASDDDGVLAKAFREDYNRLNKMTKEELAFNALELDAYAFTKYIMNKWYGIKCPHPDIVIDGMLDLYIKKYLD